ncbi:MAG: SDR family oxidoreductase [Marinifilaceae bacterium]
MNQTVVITGCSSGIGRETALYFQKKGWNVAATMRQPEKDTELFLLPNVKLFHLNVTNEKSIHKAIDDILSEFGSIDVVVNNAGYATMGAFETASEEQIQKQFSTNVFGIMRITKILLPLFRKRKKGTIINVASIGGRITFPLYSLYNSTKWAIEGFSECLQFEVRKFNIRIKIIEPGAIRTDFYTRSMDPLKKEGLNAYDEYVSTTFANMKNMGENATPPSKVAATIYKAATDGRKKMRYPVGGFAPTLLFLRWLLPTSWFCSISALVLERKPRNKSKEVNFSENLS